MIKEDKIKKKFMEEKTCVTRLMHYLKQFEKLQRLKQNHLKIAQQNPLAKQWARLRQKTHQLNQLEERVIKKINALPLTELEDLPPVEKEKTLSTVRALQQRWKLHKTTLQQREAVVTDCLQCFVSPCYNPAQPLGPLLEHRRAVSSA